MPERIFSKDEVAALLERTTELEIGKNRSGKTNDGLSLSELEHVAAEAGLDVALLRDAVAQMESRSLLQDSHRDKSATHNLLERWMDGSVSDDAWADLVMDLRNRFDTDAGASMGMPGYGLSTTETMGRNREWRHTSLMGVETRILLREMGGRTRIRMSQKVGLASPLTESIMYGGILAMFGALVSAAALDSALLGLVSFAAMLALFIPAVLAMDTSWRRKKHNELAILSEEIVQLVQMVQEDGIVHRTSETVATLENRGDPELSLEDRDPDDAPSDRITSATRQRS